MKFLFLAVPLSLAGVTPGVQGDSTRSAYDETSVGALDESVNDEDKIVHLEGEVDEVFEESAEISTPFFAGIISGPLIDKIDFSRLRFYVPISLGPQSICYTAVSRNGSYAASARNGALTIPAGARVVQPAFKAANQQRLQQFGIEDVAIRGRLGRDCATNPDAPYLPAAYHSQRTNLTVMIQSRRSRSADIQITDQNGRIATGACRADPAKVSVQFDMICSAPLAGLSLSGTSELKVRLLDRRGKEFVETARLAWP